jgi:hypothetical protein
MQDFLDKILFRPNVPDLSKGWFRLMYVAFDLAVPAIITGSHNFIITPCPNWKQQY